MKYSPILASTLAVVVFLFSGCQTVSNRQLLPAQACESVTSFLSSELSDYQTQLDSASRDYQEEQWRIEIADPKASQEKLAANFEKLQKVTYQKEVLDQATSLWAAVKDIPYDQCVSKKAMERAVGILSATIVSDPKVIQLEKENQKAQDTFSEKSNGFRITIEGESEPISKALFLKKLGSTESRKERERLYRKYSAARAKVWQEWGFKDLIKKRNQEAKAAGFTDFYVYRFHRNQLDLASFKSLLQQVKNQLAPKVRREMKKIAASAKIKNIQPWDFRYLRERSSAGEINEWLKNAPESSALDLAKRFYSELGIDVDSYGFVMDLFPRKGKNTHAFAMAIVYPHVDKKGKLKSSPKPDIRFVANLRKPVTWEDISTVIHELGHAIHAGEVRQPIDYFRGIGSVETEAIAMLVERMAESPEFMEMALPSVTGQPLEKIRAGMKKQIQASRTEQAIMLMRQMHFADFEMQVYQDPDQDLAKLWSKTHQEYWGFTMAPEFADWDVEHYVMAPVYVQNYAIGILMVEQLHDSIRKEFNTSFRSRLLGEKLKDQLLHPGVEFDYLQMTESFTKAPLSATSALGLL